MHEAYVLKQYLSSPQTEFCLMQPILTISQHENTACVPCIQFNPKAYVHRPHISIYQQCPNKIGNILLVSWKGYKHKLILACFTYVLILLLCLILTCKNDLVQLKKYTNGEVNSVALY